MESGRTAPKQSSTCPASELKLEYLFIYLFIFNLCGERKWKINISLDPPKRRHFQFPIFQSYISPFWLYHGEINDSRICLLLFSSSVTSPKMYRVTQLKALFTHNNIFKADSHFFFPLQTCCFHYSEYPRIFPLCPIIQIYSLLKSNMRAFLSLNKTDLTMGSRLPFLDREHGQAIKIPLLLRLLQARNVWNTLYWGTKRGMFLGKITWLHEKAMA